MDRMAMSHGCHNMTMIFLEPAGFHWVHRFVDKRRQTVQAFLGWLVGHIRSYLDMTLANHGVQRTILHEQPTVDQLEKQWFLLAGLSNMNAPHIGMPMNISIVAMTSITWYKYLRWCGEWSRALRAAGIQGAWIMLDCCGSSCLVLDDHRRSWIITVFLTPMVSLLYTFIVRSCWPLLF